MEYSIEELCSLKLFLEWFLHGYLYSEIIRFKESNIHKVISPQTHLIFQNDQPPPQAYSPHTHTTPPQISERPAANNGMFHYTRGISSNLRLPSRWSSFNRFFLPNRQVWLNTRPFGGLRRVLGSEEYGFVSIIVNGGFVCKFILISIDCFRLYDLIEDRR